MVAELFMISFVLFWVFGAFVARTVAQAPKGTKKNNDKSKRIKHDKEQDIKISLYLIIGFGLRLFMAIEK